MIEYSGMHKKLFRESEGIFQEHTRKVRGQSCQRCSVRPYIGPGLACDVVMFEAATSIHGRKEEAEIVLNSLLWLSSF